MGPGSQPVSHQMHFSTVACRWCCTREYKWIQVRGSSVTLKFYFFLGSFAKKLTIPHRKMEKTSQSGPNDCCQMKDSGVGIRAPIWLPQIRRKEAAGPEFVAQPHCLDAEQRMASLCPNTLGSRWNSNMSKLPSPGQEGHILARPLGPEISLSAFEKVKCGKLSSKLEKRAQEYKWEVSKAYPKSA